MVEVENFKSKNIVGTVLSEWRNKIIGTVRAKVQKVRFYQKIQ